jgi:hypothetical protein
MSNLRQIQLILILVIFTTPLLFNCLKDSSSDEFIDYADEHYNWVDFMYWWNSLPEYDQNIYSHRLPFNDSTHSIIMNDDYYLFIARYDQFQIGWDDIPSNAYPPPYGEAVMSPHRSKYIELYNDF